MSTRFKQFALMAVAAVLAAQLAVAADQKPNSLACDRVRFSPTPGGEKAMVGGRFEGSNVSRTEGFELLTEIKTAPPAGQWSELKFDNTKLYRWLRYVGPAEAPGKAGKMEFYAGDRLLGSNDQRKGFQFFAFVIDKQNAGG